MDKKNLYYIVIKGTNDQRMTHNNIPYMADSDAADMEIKDWAKNCEKISIADFEETFRDKGSE